MPPIVCPMCRLESSEGTIMCPKCGLHFVEKKPEPSLSSRHWEASEIIATVFGTLALLGTAYSWIQNGFTNTYTVVSLAVTIICILYFLVSELERWLAKI